MILPLDAGEGLRPLWLSTALRYYSRLDLDNILGHRPAVALFHLKAHSFTISECLKPGRVNRGVMNEYVRTFILFNKAISLFLTKPLHRSFCQSADLLSRIFYSSLGISGPFSKGNGPLEQTRRTGMA